MPRYLYLLRHAETQEKQTGQHDRERELTQTGVREALLIGAYLHREKITFDSIHSSTAARCVATAGIVADAMKVETGSILLEEALYDASTRTLFGFVTQLDDDNGTALCIGHNPVMSFLAESLTKAEIDTIPPGGLVIIKFNVDHWKDIAPGGGELQNFVYPKMLMGN
ncbi:MAG: histidine phosphatase family protein [Chryseolinea sp.]